VSLRGTQVDFLVTAEHAKGCSVFEFSVAPGFDTGAHYHTKIEEIFYVLEGELTLRAGEEKTAEPRDSSSVAAPNQALHLTASSLRSCLAPASGSR
jgi:quercetin dioxygenase-like cupin family protein